VADQNIKINVPGLGVVEGRPVSITESTERWTELQLEDGSVLRVKPQIVKVLRADNRYDQEGNPIYVIQGGQIMVVSSAPEHLRQPGKSEGPKVH
jgi:hypothetical protein